MDALTTTFHLYLVRAGYFISSEIVKTNYGFRANLHKFDIPKKHLFTSVVENDLSFTVFLSFRDIEEKDEIKELFYKK